MEILYIEQGTEAWHQARLGSIGGSSIAAAVAQGTGATRQTLLYKLAGELLTGKREDSFVSSAMVQGLEREPDARLLYEMIEGVEVKQVGLIRDKPHCHCSPDGLVEERGMIEIKSPQIPAHVETLDKQKVPAQYVKQIQWSLQRTSREWLDFVSYNPEIITKPIFIKRCYRDEKLIKKLEEGADQFIAEMLEMVERIEKNV